MDDIDALSRKVPYLCKVAPATNDYFMEDVHRAGGVIAILGELDRAGLLNSSVNHLAAMTGTMDDVLSKWDIVQTDDEAIKDYYRADASGITGAQAYSHDTKGKLDTDRVGGCLRNLENAHSQEGGLAVLFGNLAEKGCIVKTGAVKEHMFTFEGPARVFDSQDTAIKAIGSRQIEKGDVVVIRYEGPKGGPGMQEMLTPTSMLKGMRLDTSCALITDGRFSGGTSGLSIGHISPEAGAGGTIALIEEGDTIKIDIPTRLIELDVSDEVLTKRRAAKEAGDGFVPAENRTRKITQALKVYSGFAASADQGGVRILPE